MEGRKRQGQLAEIQVFFFFPTISLKIVRHATATTIAAQWQVTQCDLFLFIDVYGGICGLHLLVPCHGVSWSFWKAVKTAQDQEHNFFRTLAVKNIRHIKVSWCLQRDKGEMSSTEVMGKSVLHLQPRICVLSTQTNLVLKMSCLPVFLPPLVEHLELGLRNWRRSP